MMRAETIFTIARPQFSADYQPTAIYQLPVSPANQKK